MTFVGGTWHSLEAPMWVQQLVLGGWVEIRIPERQPETPYRPAWAEPEQPKQDSHVETYVVRTWNTNDQAPFKFLAIAGRDRNYIESLAWKVFKA